MKKQSLLFVLLLVAFLGCEPRQSGRLQEKDAAELEVLRTEIEALAASETCTDPSLWNYAALGSKPCGGPWSYIAYSSSIDTNYFLNLVEELRVAEAAYNEHWNIASDCAFAVEPSGVDCQNGLAVLMY